MRFDRLLLGPRPQQHREHILVEMKQCQCICPLSWSVHWNFTGEGKYNERGWACTPHPHQPGLILPSSLNVRQKAAVATLCTLCSANSQISGLVWFIVSTVPTQMPTTKHGHPSPQQTRLPGLVWWNQWLGIVLCRSMFRFLRIRTECKCVASCLIYLNLLIYQYANEMK